MRINWKIEKKRGNLRPTLTYSVSLEEHEKALALPPLRIVSNIPKPAEHWQEHCYPGQFERLETCATQAAYAPERTVGSFSATDSGITTANSVTLANSQAAEFYELEIPSHKGHAWTQTLRLPWREDNLYPEVAKSFEKLREAFEAELSSANASLPLMLEDSLETSLAAKAEIAPGVLAERFLKLARKSASAG